jgi:hypothetical protein
MGNHERYDLVYTEAEELTRKDLGGIGFQLLERQSVVIDGVRFLGCTLWSRIPPDQFFHALKHLNDYNWIFQPPSAWEPLRKPITPNHVNEWHERDLEWLTTQLLTPFNGPTVVVTHHHPVFNISNQHHQGDPLNVCYATDLSELILATKPKYWLCGHVHTAGQVQVGETLVVCNPRGYDLASSRRNGFNNKLVLEV